MSINRFILFITAAFYCGQSYANFDSEWEDPIYWKRAYIACSELSIGTGAPSIKPGGVNRAYLKAVNSVGKKAWAGVFRIKGGVFSGDKWIGPLYFETNLSNNPFDLNLSPLLIPNKDHPFQSAHLEYDTGYSDFVLIGRESKTRSIDCKSNENLKYYLDYDSSEGAREKIRELLNIQ